MADDDSKRIAAKGRKRVVEYAVRKDGSMPAKDFVDGLDRRDRNHLRARFLHLADGGEQEMNNDQVFKAERPPFWTFKRKSKNSPKGGAGMIRIPCFRIGERWILTHGFWKPPQSEWPEREFAMAEQIRKEFWRERNKRCGGRNDIMADDLTQLSNDPEEMRVFQQERLVVEITELMCKAMKERGIRRGQLAEQLNKSKGRISQILNGEANLTLRTVADVFTALGKTLTLSALDVFDERRVLQPHGMIVDLQSLPPNCAETTVSDTSG